MRSRKNVCDANISFRSRKNILSPKISFWPGTTPRLLDRSRLMQRPLSPMVTLC